MMKNEIIAMMMRNENQFENNPVAVAAKLDSCLKLFSDRLRDDELS